jgi:hypothetical protein
MGSPDSRALDVLANEVSELMWQVHRAQEMIRQVERADDTQALINFAALAQFANPECLPTFERRIPGGRVPQSVRPTQPARPVPDGIPYPRRPTEAP